MVKLAHFFAGFDVPQFHCVVGAKGGQDSPIGRKGQPGARLGKRPHDLMSNVIPQFYWAANPFGENGMAVANGQHSSHRRKSDPRDPCFLQGENKLIGFEVPQLETITVTVRRRQSLAVVRKGKPVDTIRMGPQRRHEPAVRDIPQFHRHIRTA